MVVVAVVVLTAVVVAERLAHRPMGVVAATRWSAGACSPSSLLASLALLLRQLMLHSVF